MDDTAHAMGERNGVAALWMAIAITALGPGVDAPVEMHDDATLTLRFERHMILQDPGVRARALVGVFEALIDDDVDNSFPAECAEMLRDIGCRNLH